MDDVEPLRGQMEVNMKSNVGEEIGKRIRTRLEVLDITETELARRMGCTPKLISQYVTGAAVTPVDRIVEIAKALECTTDELLGHPTTGTDKNDALRKVIAYCRELMK